MNRRVFCMTGLLPFVAPLQSLVARDDTAYLQGLIDCTPRGGNVILPAGTFRITRALEISRGVWVHGSPNTSTKLMVPRYGGDFARFTGDGGTVTGFWIDGYES